MRLPDLDKILEKPRAEAAFLVLACALTAAYRGFGFAGTLLEGVPATSHISYDGVFYAQIARNILAGDGLGWEAMLFPVLQPLIVASVSYVNDISNLSFIANYVSQTAGGAILIPVYFLAREYYGKKAAAAAVLVLIPYPHLVATAGADTAEALYTFLIYLSLFVCYRALSHLSPGRLLLAGACLGLTYLARPEGLFVFAVLFVLAGWWFAKQESYPTAAKALALMAAGFLVFALPYMVFLTKSYGRVVLSPKLPYESVVMKAKVLGEPMNMDEVEGLTPGGEIVWREKGGAGLVLQHFRNAPGKFMRSYLRNLVSELPWNVRNSSHLEGYPIVYPVYLWALALGGFGLLAICAETRWKAVLLWAPFFNLFIYPVFTDGFWIYHAPYVPSLVILAVGGVLHVEGALSKRAGRALPILLVLVAAWFGYAAHVRFLSKPHEVEVVKMKAVISDESQMIGEWGRANLGTDKTYMMRWSRLVYYLGGRWVTLPFASGQDVMAYAARNNADYIVEELVGDAALKGPEFGGLPGLELKQVYRSPNAPYVVVFWRIRGDRF